MRQGLNIIRSNFNLSAELILSGEGSELLSFWDLGACELEINNLVNIPEMRKEIPSLCTKTNSFIPIVFTLIITNFCDTFYQNLSNGETNDKKLVLMIYW